MKRSVNANQWEIGADSVRRDSSCLRRPAPREKTRTVISPCFRFAYRVDGYEGQFYHLAVGWCGGGGGAEAIKTSMNISRRVLSPQYNNSFNKKKTKKRGTQKMVGGRWKKSTPISPVFLSGGNGFSASLLMSLQWHVPVPLPQAGKEEASGSLLPFCWREGGRGLQFSRGIGLSVIITLVSLPTQ